MRVGIGYDVHRLTKGRKLIIGGVHIDYAYGLDGHSDADVLIHAIIDSLLGAASMGDIGTHFPDNDEKYKDIDSMKLLEEVANKLDDAGYIIENIDSIIIAQEPKISPYKNEMRNNIAKVLGIEKNRINIKATTEEKLGFTGKLEGISAKAICLLEKLDYYGEKREGCCCHR